MRAGLQEVTVLAALKRVNGQKSEVGDVLFVILPVELARWRRLRLVVHWAGSLPRGRIVVEPFLVEPGGRGRDELSRRIAGLGVTTPAFEEKIERGFGQSAPEGAERGWPAALLRLCVVYLLLL